MGQPMTIFDRDAANAIVYEEHEPDEHARSRGIAHRTPRDPSEVVERVAALVSALSAARAEIERLRTAAADERADVVAMFRARSRRWRESDTSIGQTVSRLYGESAIEVEQGAHVGAAKGVER